MQLGTGIGQVKCPCCRQAVGLLFMVAVDEDGMVATPPTMAAECQCPHTLIVRFVHSDETRRYIVPEVVEVVDIGRPGPLDLWATHGRAAAGVPQPTHWRECKVGK